MYIDSADSPLGISLRSPLLVRSPPTSCSSSREESSWDSFQPLLPEVCLSQIWQETQIAVRYTKLLIAGWRVSLWELVLCLVVLFQTSKYLHVRTLWNPTIQHVFLKLTCTSQQGFLSTLHLRQGSGHSSGGRSERASTIRLYHTYLKLVLTKTKRASCSGDVKIKGFFHSTKIPVWNFGNSTCQMERNIPVRQTQSKPLHVWLLFL